jgi:hypothetical protein
MYVNCNIFQDIHTKEDLLGAQTPYLGDFVNHVPSQDVNLIVKYLC